MTMLENEKRDLTSEEALALIDANAQALINTRLDRALDNFGNSQFNAEFVHIWRTLCRHLLRTFKFDDKNVSLMARIRCRPFSMTRSTPINFNSLLKRFIRNKYQVIG
jgi:hypothetical protein